MNLSKEKIQEILQKEIILDRKHFAYLSLTHKNELNFRDILVLYLQDKYENKEYSFGRELKKIDLSIIHDSKIKTVIELKSMYMTEILYKQQTHLTGLQNDFNKSFKLTDYPISNTEGDQISDIYGIMLYVFAEDTCRKKRSGAQLKRDIPELTYPTLITKRNDGIKSLIKRMEDKTNQLFPDNKYEQTEIFLIEEKLSYKDIEVSLYGQVIKALND
ncbi:hypothetical protein [Enterococcus sp.]|uniref:hypothetical protein n=1 Tax=Enterococcus sp. TaxID=35783 RepID=UPI0029137DD9|nr:hypothetical protein [Enterococcus sp.]MDU5335825.1 hypothetical protein [Enterococcus sp.]